MSRYQQILDVISTVRAHVRWKPDREVQHLQKRIQRGQLPPGSTIRDYEAMILTVLQDRSADVYLYWYNLVP